MGAAENASEIDRLLHDFVLVSSYTGARRKAVERLTTFQVNLATGRINLRPSGQKQTKKRKPIVPVYPEIREVLERLLERAKDNKTEYVFGGPHDFYRRFAKLMANIGVDGHPHMLRHSRATHMLMDGEPMYKVARLLGDTIATVERNYGHHEIEFLHTESGVG